MSGYDISHQIKNCEVYVKALPGAKTECMKDYAHPTARENPDHVLIPLVLIIFQPDGNQIS